MDNNEPVTAAEKIARRRLQLTMLAAFDEIAQTFLNAVRGERGTGKVFASLQNYLDGATTISGAHYRRRAVLLAIHDMKEEREAPPTLQSRTLAQLILLKVRPIPQLKLYRDIATAILRMEVVMRLAVLQNGEEGETQFVLPLEINPRCSINRIPAILRQSSSV